MAPARTCDCGSCRKCRHRDYMREWYARPENTQRHRETSMRSRQRRIEYVRLYDRMRGHRSGGPEKDKARAELFRAVMRGEVKRSPCEVCGELKVDGHHDDYSKPLEVRWLCRTHHMELHRRVAA